MAADWDLFRTRLKKLRGNKSMRTVSELSGIQSDLVRRYERGESIPSCQSIDALADYFEVSVDWLMGRDE